jgi:peptidoglycan/LPS O-acetylase OafA/YrhL
MSIATSHDRRVFGLDLLRALSVLFVVYGHGYYLIKSEVDEGIYNIPVFDGVTAFFVLSGFLIGRILLRTIEREDFGGKILLEFWIRRWFRTIPNYIAVLLFLLLAFSLLDKPISENAIYYFAFSQNLYSRHPNFFPEAWSLAVEEWFYLLIPIPLYLASRWRSLSRRRLMLICIFAVILAVTAFRMYRAYKYGYANEAQWDANLRKQVLTRLDSLMIGVLGAYLSLYHSNAWRRIAGAAFAFGILLLVGDKVFLTIFQDMHGAHSPEMLYRNYLTLSVTPFAVLLLLPALSMWKKGGGALVSTVTFVSLTSYSMYLLNLTPVQGVILPIALDSIKLFCWTCSQSKALAYSLYWLFTVAGAFLLYKYFERPMTGLRDKRRARSTPPAVAFSPTE